MMDKEKILERVKTTISISCFQEEEKLVKKSNKNILKEKISEDNTENKEKSSITNSRNISNTTDKPIFEILGIKLFLDDLIIIGVMYFLYQQHVHDEMLYLILFMLLFS